MLAYMRLIATILLPILICFSATAQRELKKLSIDDYIKAYSDIAINEMKRGGVPASITLAQGILESNYGNSPLAEKANNHFGIKCHTGWTGKGYYMDDDAKNECFRVYDNPKESYHDHTEFLRTRQRYAFLFELTITDYKSWAKGLQRAGYATNPQYANLLIRIIEERKLNNFDEETKEITVLENVSKVEELVDKLPRNIFLYNGIKTVIVHPNDDLPTLSQQYQVSVKRLAKYNNIAPDATLKTGSKIYLQPKKGKGTNKVYEVKPGETMWSISQKQGIKLKALHKKNHMMEGEEPAIGAMLCMKKKCKEKPALRTPEELKKEVLAEVQAHQDEVREAYKQQRADSLKAIGYVEPKTEEPKTEPVITITKTETEPEVIKEQPQTETLPGPIYHTVQPGETLFAISRKYSTNVDNLREWNNLVGSDLTVGKTLVVGYGKVKPITPPPGVEMINDPSGDNAQKDKEALEDVVFNPDDLEEPEVIEEAVKEVVEETPKEASPEVKKAVSDAANEPILHRVAKGETLYAISRIYGVSVANLKDWNNMQDNTLAVGDELTVGYGANKKEVNVAPEEILEEKPIDEPKNEKAFSEFHIVEPKQTLYSISKIHDVTVEQLREWNKLESDALTTGQKLIVYDAPKNVQDAVPLEKEIVSNERDKAPVYHRVAAGDTYYSISKKYRVSVEQIKQWNQFEESGLMIGEKLVVGELQEETPVIDEDKPIYHTVKKGQTLYQISILYKESITHIKEWNNLGDANLSEGQKLIIGFE